MDLEQLRSERRPQAYLEAKRICSLPVAEEPDAETLERYSFENVQAGPYREGFRLLPAQAVGLYTFDQYKGGFFDIAVGKGKTGLSLLIASHAFRDGMERNMLIIPPSVYQQLMEHDVPWARKNLVIETPIIGLGKMSKDKRLNVAARKRPGLYVVPYSLLSTEDTQELLNLVEPKLIICDEAHELRRKGKSAKTKRLFTYIERNKPLGVAMSGTLTSKTPMDYHHIMRWCLGQRSPLPIPVVLAQTWSTALRSGAEAPDREQLAALRTLLYWAGERGQATTAKLRRAYYKRLRSCPGYVSSPAEKVSCSIEIANLRAKPSPDLLAMIKTVEDDWVGPNGEEFSHAIETYEILQELSAGFYFERPWPEDHPLVDQAKAHWEALQEYHRELRGYFSGHRMSPELDTPLLVGKRFADVRDGIARVPRGLGDAYALWSKVKELEHDELPERLRIPHLVDPFKLDLAVRWTKKHKHGIIWVHHRIVGQWVCERLEEAGLPHVYMGAGAKWTKDKVLAVASINAHGVGKNLQHHTNQLILQWPRPADQAEQLLGRVHRQGQLADRLVVHTARSLPWDSMQLAATLRDTVYFKETLGTDRKLLIADWNPLPEEYPEEFLRAKGFYA